MNNTNKMYALMTVDLILKSKGFSPSVHAKGQRKQSVTCLLAKQV